MSWSPVNARSTLTPFGSASLKEESAASIEAATVASAAPKAAVPFINAQFVSKELVVAHSGSPGEPIAIAEEAPGDASTLTIDIAPPLPMRRRA
jgi:hypothetical protein